MNKRKMKMTKQRRIRINDKLCRKKRSFEKININKYVNI